MRYSSAYIAYMRNAVNAMSAPCERCGLDDCERVVVNYSAVMSMECAKLFHTPACSHVGGGVAAHVWCVCVPSSGCVLKTFDLFDV